MSSAAPSTRGSSRSSASSSCRGPRWPSRGCGTRATTCWASSGSSSVPPSSSTSAHSSAAAGGAEGPPLEVAPHLAQQLGAAHLRDDDPPQRPQRLAAVHLLGELEGGDVARVVEVG